MNDVKKKSIVNNSIWKYTLEKSLLQELIYLAEVSDPEYEKLL